MDDIKFKSLTDKKSFFKTNDVKYLGSGWEGSCYKKGNKVYKLYNNVFIDYIYNGVFSKEGLVKFSDVFIDNIYFIRALIYCEGFVVGSISDYASGRPCGDIKMYNVKIDNLINALKVLKNNIFELSELGIFIEDEFINNILYNGKNFKFIDTSRYYRFDDVLCDDDDIDDVCDIYELNMIRIMNILLGAITDKKEFNDNFVFNYLNKVNSCYKDYMIDKDLFLNPDTTINGIKDEIQNGIGREITTFGDCRKDLLRIKKR